MYKLTKGIYVDFAHQIKDHPGPCINIHGHTWKFEVDIETDKLNDQGFVIDFKDLNKFVFTPLHNLLDHSFVCGKETWDDIKDDYIKVSKSLVANIETKKIYPYVFTDVVYLDELDTKVVVFEFTPTCERLSRWLHEIAMENLSTSFCYDQKLTITGRVYESLHPVECYTEYTE